MNHSLSTPRQRTKGTMKEERAAVKAEHSSAKSSMAVNSLGFIVFALTGFSCTFLLKGNQDAGFEQTLLTVFSFAWITAASSALGIVPLLLVSDINSQFLGACNGMESARALLPPNA